MRWLIGGLLSLIFVFSSFAQVTGQVDSLGFGGGGGVCRPDAWIPMVVQLQSDSIEPKRYNLDVVQYDLDGDEVVYTRPVDLDNNLRPFWMYFRPQPINGGLAAFNVSTTRELQQQLRVYISDKDTHKRLVQLPVGKNLPQMVDISNGSGGRGQKVVLFVGRLPNLRELGTSSFALKGVMEDMIPVRVDPRDLPESALGYDMVDAIVWTDADTAPLDAGRLKALNQYVRGGGRLVISQQATDWQRSLKFGTLLPVTIKGIDELSVPEPLRSIAKWENWKAYKPAPGQPAPKNPWITHGPYRVARGEAAATALVDETIEWTDKSISPFLVRQAYDLGSVTWIAQDLSDPAVTVAGYGWPLVWDRVFDWKNKTVISPTSVDGDNWDTQSRRDIGKTLLSGTDLTGRSTLMVTLAFVFFIAYWLIAGPANYLLLAARKQTGASWFVFGGIALGALLLTLVVVQLVVRGQPQLAHVSLVRATADESKPARVLSRVGLYIPRSGDEMIGLSGLTPDGVSTLTPFAVHPGHRPDAPRLRDTEYLVPISDQDVAAKGRLEVTIPYRSTLKKLQLDWTGEMKGRIGGAPVMERNRSLISGPLSNGTGQKLRNVYIAFRYPSSGGGYQDWMLYVPRLDAGQTIELTQAFNVADDGKFVRTVGVFEPDRGEATPDGVNRCKGLIQLDWSPWLAKRGLLGAGNGVLSDDYSDSSSVAKPSLIVLSLFDHLQPQMNSPQQSRAETLRRGARQWDVSGALSAGAMIVIAEADDVPLPAPLTVGGSPVDGKGTTYYQFILPVDYAKARAIDAKNDAEEKTAAATQPATPR